MNRSLHRLQQLMTPLRGQRHTVVDWAVVERAIGLEYPSSFKDFVGIYGSSHWFDKLIPIYPVGSSPPEISEFKSLVADQLNWIKDNQLDENYEELDLPLYPQPGGLFPFLNDINGPIYSWMTDGRNPDKWPVYCWMRGPITVLKNYSISELLVGYFERESDIVRILGDIQDLDPQRLRIDDRCAT